MTIGYTAKSDFSIAGKPRAWSGIRVRLNGNLSTYDVASEGKRIAAMMADQRLSDQKPLTHLTVLVNFIDALRRRVPVGVK